MTHPCASSDSSLVDKLTYNQSGKVLYNLCRMLQKSKAPNSMDQLDLNKIEIPLEAMELNLIL